MDLSPSALLTEIRMEDIEQEEEHNCIFSGFEIYDPNQFQENAFKDDDEDEEEEEFASTDQIIMALMEDDQNALAMAPPHECGVEHVNGQMSDSVTAVESSVTTATATATIATSFTDFVNSTYELIPSPASFNFVSMILEEAMNDNTDVVDVGNVVDGHKYYNGSDSVNVTKCISESDQISKKRSRSIGRNHVQIKDHILSERKRREKLSQLFIALAAMVPHLKKTDKASILAGAIEHLKHLKQKDASLRDELVKSKKKLVALTETKRTTSQAISSRSLNTTSSLMSLNNIINGGNNVDVKYDGKSILVRINMDNIKKGTIINLLHGIEMSGLTVTKSCFFPFGDSALAITIIVTMDEEFSLAANELVTNLHALINEV